jgi:hypothetical protein
VIHTENRPLSRPSRSAQFLTSHKMALFNEFHRVRRFANGIEYDEAREHALSWIELLDKIDEVTNLEQRFDLCGTNAACRSEMIELAKKYGVRLTMHVILSVCKGGHTATYRTRDGHGWFGEQFGTHLSWFTTIDRKDLNPMNQFHDSRTDAQRERGPNELAEQFADLMDKRGNLVELSRKNQQEAVETGLSNVAVMYGSVATLHAYVLSIFREAGADGSLEAIEIAITKAAPFCEEATETEREIVKILKSDAGDAPPRVLH